MTDKTDEKTVVAVGAFASLHLGHRELVEKTVKLAREKGIKSCVFTFDTGLDTHKGTGSFLEAEQKLERLKRMGVDMVYVQKFDHEFKSKSPESFVRDILKKQLNCMCVVVGENFRFGKNAEGNAETLAALCAASGMECEIQPLKRDEQGNVISTSYLLELAKAGETQRVEKILGRPLRLAGRVIHGRHDGTKIGFPTVNVKVEKDAIVPGKGVYISETDLDGKKYPSITNIGNAPTFDSHDELTETHIIGASEDLYGRFIEIYIHGKIRDISKFDSVEELKNRLKADTQKALEFWENKK